MRQALESVTIGIRMEIQNLLLLIPCTVGIYLVENILIFAWPTEQIVALESKYSHEIAGALMA